MDGVCFVGLGQVELRRKVVGSKATCCRFTRESLSQYLLDFEYHGDLSGSSSILSASASTEDLAKLIGGVALGCKRIQKLVRSVGLGEGKELYTMNRANSALKSSLWHTGRAGVLSSGEEHKALMVQEWEIGDYICVFDPLNGFRDLNAGLPTGTIFGIYRKNLTCMASDWESRVNEEEVASMRATLQPGANLIVAGYCMYSSSTNFVVCIGSEVIMFVYDAEIGDFVLVKQNQRIPSTGYYYSFDEAQIPIWDEKIEKYIYSLRDGSNAQHKKYKTRYETRATHGRDCFE